MERIRTLLVALAAALLLVAPSASAATFQETLTQVTQADGYKYAAKDNAGRTMDTLKIIRGGAVFIGVYHTLASGVYSVHYATSPDLQTWTYRQTLATNASQPTIGRDPAGGYWLGYEADAGCAGDNNCLALKHYANYSGLLNNSPISSVLIPRTFSSCAEGTPNFFAITATSLDVGFHYFSGCNVDRQARGTYDVTNGTWTPRTTPAIDNAILAAGAHPDGNIGDRDGLDFQGTYSRVYEGMTAPRSAGFGSWRVFAYEGGAATQLAPQTHGGSTAFANPTATRATLPDGTKGTIVTYFLPSEGAASGESGTLIFWRRDFPLIAAAGDISTTSITNQDETAALVNGWKTDAVLTLGDNQYDNGELANFNSFYNPTWGIFKAITKPSPGNHDPCSSGYGSYFPTPNCRYTYTLGDWRIYSLDSNNVSSSAAFLDANLADDTEACTLAYWHHPRFSSGTTHGNNSGMGPLWDRLYAAGADVVLVGHEHHYERFAKQTPTAVASTAGIREFVSGLGGRSKYSFGTPVANSEFRYNTQYGVLQLSLKPDSYDWKFINTAGVVVDSGTDSCSL